MHANTKRLGAFALGSILMALVGAAPSAWADAPWSGSGTAADPYRITSVADLQALQTWTADSTKSTVGLYFKQMDDINMDVNNGGVYWSGIGVNQSMSADTSFCGVYDGDFHRVYNLTFENSESADSKYNGFFQTVFGATIQNLTIEVLGFHYPESEKEFGGAAFLGTANKGSLTLRNLTAKGAMVAKHNCGGIAVRIGYSQAKAEGNVSTDVFLIENCTNEMAITSTGTKIGGLVSFCQRQTGNFDPMRFVNCANKAALSGKPGTGSISSAVAGLVAWHDDAISFENCYSSGSLTASDGNDAYTASMVGQNSNNASYKAIALGGNKTTLTTAVPVIGNASTGFGFATVDGGVATFVTPVQNSGLTYKVMLANAPYTFTAAATAQTLILDEDPNAAVVGPSSDTYFTLTKSDSNPYTYTFSMNDPVAMTVSAPGAHATVAAKVGTAVLPLSGTALTAPNGAPVDVVVTVDAGWEFTSYDGWTKNGQTYTKQVTAEASAAVTTPTGATMTPTWTGDGTSAATAWQIATVADLQALQTWVENNQVTLGKFWKQTGNIDMDVNNGGVYWSGIGRNQVGTYEYAFCGTYNGQNFTISNVTFENKTDASCKYMGFFQSAHGATIENLTINVVGFKYTTAEVGSGIEFGGAAFVGIATRGGITLRNLTATGAMSVNHNAGGIAVKLGHKDQSAAADQFLVENCTNKMALTSTYSKVGGMAAFCQRQGTATEANAMMFVGCSNEGELHGRPKDTSSGVAGMVGWYNDIVKFENCSSTGTCVADNGNNQWACSFVGDNGNSTSYKAISLGGNTTTLTGIAPVAYAPCAVGFGFATVDGGVATFKATPSNGDKVMLAGAAVVLANFTDKITLDESLAKANVTQTLGDKYFVQAKTSDGLTTYSVAIKEPIKDNLAYTNLTFTIQAPAAGTYTITAKDPLNNSTTIGSSSVAVTFDAAGEQVVNVDVADFGAGYEIGQTYSYVITPQGSADPIAVYTFTDAGWVVDSYFGASVAAATETLVNGEWSLNKPTVGTNTYGLDSTQSVFSVTTIKTNDLRKVVQIDAELSIADYYYLDDLEEDITSAIAGIALVTNEENVADVAWMALVGGDTWTKLTGPYTTLTNYTTRMEIDYNDTAAPVVRYSVKRSVDENWTALTDDNGIEWFAAQPNALSVSNVCFAGKADLAGFSAKLRSEGVANVGGIDGTDYAKIADALAAVKDDSGKTLVLYTNIQSDPKALAVGHYQLDKQDKYDFTILPCQWRLSDGVGKAVGVGEYVLDVSEEPFVAKIADPNSNDPFAYMSLSEAFFDAEGKTIVMLKNVDESVFSTTDDVVLDLGGFTLSKGIGNQPILTIGSSEVAGVDLVITNGVIASAPTGYAAIKALNGAGITLDSVAMVDNVKAISAAGGSQVTICSGYYKGTFEATGDGTLYTILSGYFLDTGAGETTFPAGKVSASGGMFSAGAGASLGAAGVADGYKLGELAVVYTPPSPYSGYSVKYEIMEKINPSGEEPASKVWNVADTGVSGVQITDDWMSKNTTGATAEEKQADLKQPASYKGSAGTTTMTKWEAYVLGMTSSTTSEGPTLKGVQDDKPTKIGFSILTPETIKAAESGCEVKFTVQSFTNPGLTEGAGVESAKANYDETVELDVPASGVRYYKLKMYITPKQ